MDKILRIDKKNVFPEYILTSADDICCFDTEIDSETAIYQHEDKTKITIYKKSIDDDISNIRSFIIRKS